VKKIPLAQLAEALGKNLDRVARTVKFTLFRDVILDTRVDKGRLRANWQISVDAPITEEIDSVDKTGQTTINKVADTVKGNTVDYLTNNLPYAAPREEKDGMVDKAVARIERDLKEIIKDAR
jgi:hypothetical protein